MILSKSFSQNIKCIMGTETATWQSQFKGSGEQGWRIIKLCLFR